MLRPSVQFHETVLNYMGEKLCFLESSCFFRLSLDNQCLSLFNYFFLCSNTLLLCVIHQPSLNTVSNFLSYFSVVPITGDSEKFVSSSVLLLKISF